MADDSTTLGCPRKPYPEFPLCAHRSGRWAKKIRGKTHCSAHGAIPMEHYVATSASKTISKLAGHLE